MFLAAWWYEDGPPSYERLPGLSVSVADDDADVERLGRLTAGEAALRRREGHRPYVARMLGDAVACSWVATTVAPAEVIDRAFALPPGNRYVWGVAEAHAQQGRGFREQLLAEIIRHESPPATRLWMFRRNDPHLSPSVGGFAPVAELSVGDCAELTLRALGDAQRALAGADLLGIRLLASP